MILPAAEKKPQKIKICFAKLGYKNDQTARHEREKRLTNDKTENKKQIKPKGPKRHENEI